MKKFYPQYEYTNEKNNKTIICVYAGQNKKNIKSNFKLSFSKKNIFCPDLYLFLQPDCWYYKPLVKDIWGFKPEVKKSNKNSSGNRPPKSENHSISHARKRRAHKRVDSNTDFMTRPRNSNKRVAVTYIYRYYYMKGQTKTACLTYLPLIHTYFELKLSLLYRCFCLEGQTAMGGDFYVALDIAPTHSEMGKGLKLDLKGEPKLKASKILTRFKHSRQKILYKYKHATANNTKTVTKAYEWTLGDTIVISVSYTHLTLPTIYSV